MTSVESPLPLGFAHTRIEYFSLNECVQNLIGFGEIGGCNIPDGAIEIQVAEKNVGKALELISSEPCLTNQA